MATIATDYTQTVVAKPVPVPGSTGGATMVPFDYKNFSVFVRPIFADGVVEEPMYQMYITSANSFFRGNEIVQPQTMLSDLAIGQETNIIIEKSQNPFDLFAKDSITYSPLDNGCLNQINLDCQMACLNTLPSFEIMKFRFDTEYTWGVVACDKNKKFWEFDYFTRQYGKSLAAKNFGREVDLWNTVVRSLIATPATTVDAKLAQFQPDHYWQNLGSVAANARDMISLAGWYFQTSFADVDPKIIMPAEMGHDIIRSMETPVGLNATYQRQNTNFAWDIPGYKVDEQVRDIIGTEITVLFLERSPWLTYAGTTAGTIVSQYPLWSADGTKQYCAILDPRVGYQFQTEGYHLDIQPYDCEHLQRGMQDSEYVGSGITFPVYGMILEFDAYQPQTPTAGIAAAAMKIVEEAVDNA